MSKSKPNMVLCNTSKVNPQLKYALQRFKSKYPLIGGMVNTDSIVIWSRSEYNGTGAFTINEERAIYLIAEIEDILEIK